MPTIPESLASRAPDETRLDMLNTLNLFARQDSAVPEAVASVLAKTDSVDTAMSGYCSILRRDVRQEERFKTIYQWLTLVTVSAAALLLVASLILLPVGLTAGGLTTTTIVGVVTAAGTIVSGTAFGVILKQRADARRRYDNAVEAYKEAGC